MVECLPHDDGARNRDHHREPKVYNEYDYRFGGMIVEHKLDPLDTPKNQQRVLHALRGTRKTSKLLCAYSKVFVCIPCWSEWHSTEPMETCIKVSRPLRILKSSLLIQVPLHFEPSASSPRSDTVDTNVVPRVLGRVIDLDYRLELARAPCTTTKGGRAVKLAHDPYVTTKCGRTVELAHYIIRHPRVLPSDGDPALHCRSRCACGV